MGNAMEKLIYLFVCDVAVGIDLFKIFASQPSFVYYLIINTVRVVERKVCRLVFTSLYIHNMQHIV